MARVAVVIWFGRWPESGVHGADLKVDPSSDPIKVQHFAPAGDDSQPLKDDYAILDEDEDSAIGYADTRNAGVAGPGEKRIYARDSNAEVVVHLHLRSDGSAILSNDEGQLELAPNGNITLNGVVIDPDGNVTTPGTIDADGEITAMAAVPAASVTLSQHQHVTGTGPSQPPTPGT